MDYTDIANLTYSRIQFTSVHEFTLDMFMYI